MSVSPQLSLEHPPEYHFQRAEEIKAHLDIRGADTVQYIRPDTMIQSLDKW